MIEKNKDMKTVERILSEEIERNRTPGLQYYYFNQDSILYSYYGGMADMANQKNITEQTTFHAYSVTKTFTALSILQLVEKGLLELDNSASLYLPDFPYSKNITIRHLLNHTAGLADPLPLSWVSRS